MVADKLNLIFGDHPPVLSDLDDEDAIRASLRADLPDVADPEVELAGRQAIASQILGDKPALVWETAQRMLTLGLDRESVMGQLVGALRPMLGSGAPEVGAAGYEAALRQLPLPTGEEVAQVVRSVITVGDRMTLEELDAAVGAQLGITDESGVLQELLDDVMDQLLDEEEIACSPMMA